MDFRLLGPLEVWRDGQPVALGRRMQRVVLGVLLLEAGRIVPFERLAEVVWSGVTLPRTYRNALQISVSNLRGALGDAVISTVGGGYRLEAGQSDLRRFQDLVASARDADLPTRIDRLSRAEAEWRGPVLAGTFSDHLREQWCVSLDEQRLAAVERRVEAQLRLGGHDEIVGELTELVRRHPYRENLAAALMIAWYRAGQVPRALAAYRTFRDALAADLGIDPGPRLRDLEVAILRRSPDLDAPSPVERPVVELAPPAVNQLPPAAVHFVGRRAELAAMAGALAAADRPAPAVVTVTGMGGLGKTTLAVEAARRAFPAYPDGCLFIDLRGADLVAVSAHRTLGLLLRSLGTPGAEVPSDRDERLIRYRSMTASRRVLVVLDNASDAAQVRPLIPGGPGCAVIVTSRQHMSTIDGTHLMLDPLTDGDGDELLERVAGAALPAAEAGATAELVRLCGGMPLALRIVGARLAGRAVTPAGLVGSMRDTTSTLAELSTGDLSVSASLAFSYQRLGRTAATLFRRLGLVGLHRFTPWTCEVLIDGPEAEPALRELVDSSLAGPMGADRFRLHDLVSRFADGAARSDETPAARTDALRRLCEAYLDNAKTAVEAQSFGRAPRLFTLGFSSPYRIGLTEVDAAQRWLREENGGAVAVMRAAASHDELRGHVWRLASVLGRHFHVAQQLDDWRDTHELGRAAAESLDDPAAMALMRVDRGFIHQTEMRYEQALDEYEAGLRLAEKSGDELLVAYLCAYGGMIRRVLGQIEPALAHIRRALAVPEYAADRREVAYNRLELANMAAMQGRFDDAYDEYRQVLVAADEFGDRRLAATAHHSFGYSLFIAGRMPEALRETRAAIALAEDIGLPMRIARGWEQLGDLLAADGAAAGAEDAWCRAIEAFEAMGDQRADVVRGKRA